MSYITEDFLLHTETARKLYHEHAAPQPIIDYHCHLPPADVAADRRFGNLYEIWLEGDHYKWRVMRANGIEERYCTGDADPKDKFLAFASTLPHCLRNPMYDWCHLELKRYFGIEKTLGPDTAEAIWEEANEKLADPAMSARGILDRFKVSVVCTTDDPTDDLEHHRKIAADGVPTRVYPTYRPDKVLALADLPAWNAWVDGLEKVSGVSCDSLSGAADALNKRHDAFHDIGGRLSDHGLETCFDSFPSDARAAELYARARKGDALSPGEQAELASWFMEFSGQLDAEKEWTKQLHLGAMRNVNDDLFARLGPDVGGDSIGDFDQGRSLGNYLGRLAGKGILPKTILYNLNPRDNYLFATMVGNFQGGGIPGKMQFGTGWWFLDQKEGMTWQINALSNLGLLGRFVGMLTDSRSFMSYCRHEYFRRLLCQIIGSDVEKGEMPNDMKVLGELVENISYGNASRYFGFALGDYT